MIHPLSISTRNPKHVTAILAELMGGVAVPFPPNPASFFALELDEHGSATRPATSRQGPA
jgi:hypothetical protein